MAEGDGSGSDKGIFKTIRGNEDLSPRDQKLMEGFRSNPIQPGEGLGDYFARAVGGSGDHSGRKRLPGESAAAYSVRTGNAVIETDEELDAATRREMEKLRASWGLGAPASPAKEPPKAKATAAAVPYTDERYAGFTGEQITEKNRYLQEIYNRHFPGSAEGAIKVKAGYHFFPALNRRVVGGRDFRDAYQDASNPFYFQFPDRYPGEIARAKEVLAQEYKVHLMPFPEYTPFILDQLFQAIQDDPELASVISQVKVIHDDKKVRDEIMPGIVIYTQLGRENAQKALDKIYEHLGKYDGLGQDKTPRYNRKVNNLVYYAQSGGDWKNDYLNGVRAMGRDVKRDGVFDPDLIHFAGDYKLKVPH